MPEPIDTTVQLNLAKLLLRQLTAACDLFLIEASRYNAQLPTHPQGKERARQLRLALRNSNQFLELDRTQRKSP